MQEKTIYLTPQGKVRFTAELEELLTRRRFEVGERLQRANELSDTVDNAEYDAAKNEQAFVEGRIQELQRMLAAAQIIEEPVKADYVAMGCRVTVTDETGEAEEYQIVGSLEADPRRGLVSNESPVGRALMGKRRGDETTVVAPGGSFTLRITEIK